MIGFDKFPCIVFLLSDNKAFSIGVFSLIHFVEYSARFLGPRFLFLCVALGKSIEICHIHFESDQPNYNPECELGLGFFRMQGRLVSFLDTTEITHPIQLSIYISIIENLHLRFQVYHDPPVKFSLLLWCLSILKFFNLVRYHKLFLYFLFFFLFFSKLNISFLSPGQ